MKVYILIDEDINSIEHVFLRKEDADAMWLSMKSERFHYSIEEYEVIE